VWRTRVGYAGGTTNDPIYRRIGDHTECFQVDFDPAAVSYDDLLQLFWSNHDPTRPAHSRQYASIVLAHDESQLSRAHASRDRLESVLQRPIITRIERLDRFYLAEDYHQKYRLRSSAPVMREFQAMYTNDSDFVESSAAARINGYLDGGGSCTRLESEISEFGLSPEASRYVRSHCR